MPVDREGVTQWNGMRPMSVAPMNVQMMEIQDASMIQTAVFVILGLMMFVEEEVVRRSRCIRCELVVLRGVM